MNRPTLTSSPDPHLLAGYLNLDAGVLLLFHMGQSSIFHPAKNHSIFKLNSVVCYDRFFVLDKFETIVDDVKQATL